jgi:putative spermidine/putrescine transport system substrate-binding protein
LPENQSKLPDFIAYGLPNKEAGAMLKPEVAQLPTAPENIAASIPLDGDSGSTTSSSDGAVRRVVAQ